MLIPGVRVRLPPRAPKRKGRFCGLFFLAESGFAAWIEIIGRGLPSPPKPAPCKARTCRITGLNPTSAKCAAFFERRTAARIKLRSKPHSGELRGGSTPPPSPPKNRASRWMPCFLVPRRWRGIMRMRVCLFLVFFPRINSIYCVSSKKPYFCAKIPCTFRMNMIKLCCYRKVLRGLLSRVTVSPMEIGAINRVNCESEMVRIHGTKFK